jgi:hypothetical protein
MLFLIYTINELQNLDYSTILFKKFNSPIAFNGNVHFKLPLVLLIVHELLQMQGMDRKYNGHAWCKVITINILKKFELSFKKACYLGHLCCV